MYAGGARPQGVFDGPSTNFDALRDELVPINQKYPLKDAAKAHRELEGRNTTGSTILIP